MIKVLIADDHKIFRDGIASLLGDEADIDLVGEAADGYQVLNTLKETAIDVILMDITMGMTSGIDTTRMVKDSHPAAQVLILSMHGESSYVVKSLEAGAAGYLLKDAGKEELLTAIRTLAAGKSYYSQQVSAALVKHLTSKSASHEKKTGVPLTKREQEILKLIAEEYSNPEIADRLFISVRTVETHRRNLLEKLGAKNTAGLVKYALRHGLLEES